ncbi:MAG: ADP/ATP carrier protein [Phylliscum demangeonii]|nr:MAG: ADP/ATP carrier protein [Phylliscum demangeonii]
MAAPSSSASPDALLPPWGNALAGATGAVLANAIVYPLDMIKTRLQAQMNESSPGERVDGSAADLVHYTSATDAAQKILADEGAAGLYAGLTGALMGVASTNFAYFYWYTAARTLYLSSQPHRRRPPSTAVELGLGALAGALAQLLTIPVAVVTTRQQTQPKGEQKGLLDTGREILDSEDGWTGFWRGFKASLVLVVNPAITYGAYQRLRDVLFPGKLNLRPGEAFLLGALSKTLATVVTQPLIVAKVGLQSRPPPSRQGRPFRTFGEVIRYIVRHEGVAGLFKGIRPQVVKGLLVQGILMMTKERMEFLFVVMFAYLRRLRTKQFQRAAELVAVEARKIMPIIVK